MIARILGTECPACAASFAVTQLESSDSSRRKDPMFLLNIKCPQCGQYHRQLAAEVLEFEAKGLEQ